MGERFRPLLKHFGAVAAFAFVSLIYFFPVLQGKAIVQSDIVQYRGMSHERDSYKEDTGKESYWTNSAFGGMPTYQLGANYPNNLVKKFDKVIRFLPRPADYLFLYMLGFYVFLLSLGIRFHWAAAGSLLFAFSTYFLIIIEVGHNAKAHAIGYMPLVLAGVLWVFRKNYIWGCVLTTLALGLEIAANHFQMTYYLGIAIGLLMVFKTVELLRQSRIREIIPILGVLLISLTLSLAMNATTLLSTAEYARWSTRGPSEIGITPDGNQIKAQSGLDYEYITQYSYGLFESLNLIVPGLLGGSNAEKLGEESHTYKYLRELGADRIQALQFAENLPLYWGNQPIVAAPAYLGVVVFFCFLLGVYLLRNNYKWWLISTALLGLLLSWGKNLDGLTRFFVEYVPLYDKFRAVSSIQVITELSIATLAVLGVYQFAQNPSSRRSLKALYWAIGSTLGILLLLLLSGGSLSFQGSGDAMYEQYYGKEFVTNLIRDRKDLYYRDIWRSTLLLISSALFFVLHARLSWRPSVLLYGWLALSIFDLWGVSRRYVNEDSFGSPSRMERPFRATEADRQIKQDKSHYRVFDLDEGYNGARTSYFHKSVGGYHAAKPRSLQNLFDFHIDRGNLEPLHMLNVKYILRKDQEGKKVAIENTGAYGNAWFVHELIPVPAQEEALMRLDSTVSDSLALWVPEVGSELGARPYPDADQGRIELTSYAPDALEYTSESAADGFVVFSEMWYPHGWKATIDGEPHPIYRVNYFLRGMNIPSGNHKIRFSFEPRVVKVGSSISLAANLFVVGLLGFALVRTYTYKKENTDITA